MFFLLILLLVGGSYLLYRYKSTSNKKIFFRSPLFLSVACSIAILSAAIAFVNMAAPPYVKEKPTLREEKTDTLTLEESDTSRQFLLSKGPAFHYRAIRKLYTRDRYAAHLTAREKSYKRIMASGDSKAYTLANFCLGVITLERGELDKAKHYFSKVANDTLPYLHYCLGDMLIKEDKSEESEIEYTLELQNKNGNRTEAFLILLELYHKNDRYEKLHELTKYDLAAIHFPDQLARHTLLYVYDLGPYAVWVLRSVLHQMNMLGLFAALSISIIWLIYLFGLDIFKPEKFISLAGMFLAGALCVLFIFLFNDTLDLHFGEWSLSGEFFHDLAYCIFLIGIPEEFVKLLPLLLLAGFIRYLKEPIDYIIYGSASALGFAFVENLLYFQEITGGIIHGRAYLSVIGHMADTSFAAYGFVISKFKRRDKSLFYTLSLSFLIASVMHGLYDFLLFHKMIILFFLFFILIIQFWIIIINNCMNNSGRFTYKIASRSERSRVFITLSLIFIFTLEYIMVGFLYGSKQSNLQLIFNAGFAGFLIFFYSSNLSSFDLVKGYWRKINFTNSQKRGYGSRNAYSPLISWYFVNAVQSHNYVGLRISVYADPYNKDLMDLLNSTYPGRIVNRIILYEGDTPDPHWFLVKMSKPIPFAQDRPDYILLKLRYNEDSLLYDDEVQVFFKAIPDARLLRVNKPVKDQFPFYGWAYMALQRK